MTADRLFRFSERCAVISQWRRGDECLGNLTTKINPSVMGNPNDVTTNAAKSRIVLATDLVGAAGLSSGIMRMLLIAPHVVLGAEPPLSTISWRLKMIWESSKARGDLLTSNLDGLISLCF